MDPSRYNTQEEYNAALTDLCGMLQVDCIDGDTLIPHIPECRVADKEHFNGFGGCMVAMALAKQVPLC